MSAPKMVTEAEAVRRERAAFVAGWEYVCGPHVPDGPRETADATYPMPTVERPRVVRIGAQDYSARPCHSGELVIHARRGDCWVPVGPGDNGAGTYRVNAERARVWADLFANPTETVPADETEAAA